MGEARERRGEGEEKEVVLRADQMEPWEEVVARWWDKGVEDVGLPKEKLRMNCDDWGRMREDVVGRATIKGVLDNARKSDAMVGCDLMIGEEKEKRKIEFIVRHTKQIEWVRESNSSQGLKPLSLAPQECNASVLASFIIVEGINIHDGHRMLGHRQLHSYSSILPVDRWHLGILLMVGQDFVYIPLN